MAPGHLEKRKILSRLPLEGCIEGEDLSLSGPALVELLRAVLGKGAPFRFRVRGFSMSPFIKDGDVVTLSPLSVRSQRVGNVVAFLYPGSGKLAIHRVVEKKGDSSLIMGDSNPGPDGLIPEKNILGVVRKVERDGRRVYLGLGPERLVIAYLNRRRLLFPLLLPVWKLIRPVLKRLYR